MTDFGSKSWKRRLKKEQIINEKGEKIYKQAVIKVFTPDKKAHSHLCYRPPAGYGVTDESIADALRQVLQQCHETYPEYEYTIIPLPRQHYNFVCTGPRKRCQTN